MKIKMKNDPEDETHFHMNGFPQRLVSTQRHKGNGPIRT